MKLTRRNILTGTLVLVLLASVYSAVYYYRDLIFGPAVLFVDDDNIEIGLYPDGFQSAFVFTVDDANKLTKPQEVRSIVAILNKYGVKGVFFVIPHYKGKYKLTKDDEITAVLHRITERGHEVAQHGLTHSLARRKLRRVASGGEFAYLPYGEQKRRVLVGRRILEDAGFEIHGFRSPAFSADGDTLKVLDSYDFLYGSNARVFPPPLMMTNKMYVESVYYPFHVKDLNLIEFVTHGDYFRGHSTFNRKNLLLIKRRFDRVYKHRGVFIMLSHMDTINSAAAFQLLDSCLEYVDSKNVWKPNMTELALWWRAREALYAESEIVDGVLRIILEKGNEFELNALTIQFKQGIQADRYEITDDTGELIKSGQVSEKVVTIDC